MKIKKPKICLVDNELDVRKGWEESLKPQAIVDSFKNHIDLLEKINSKKVDISSYQCIIFGRYYDDFKLDILDINIPHFLRKMSKRPTFLNWQGYVAKSQLEKCFDGKIFYRFGIRWATLRDRIKRVQLSFDPSFSGVQDFFYTGKKAQVTDLEKKKSGGENKYYRCKNLLKYMADNASGRHRQSLQFFAEQDLNKGLQFLEIMYRKLNTNLELPEDCPSQYINTSPIIAKRILRETLFIHN